MKKNTPKDQVTDNSKSSQDQKKPRRQSFDRFWREFEAHINDSYRSHKSETSSESIEPANPDAMPEVVAHIGSLGSQ